MIMAIRTYSSRLFSKLSFHLKFASCVRSYSKKEMEDESPFSDDNTKEPSKIVNLLAYFHRETLTWAEAKASFELKKEQKIREKQRFVPERHKILGPDIAVAQFIACCGGKVKFHGSDIWLAFESLAEGKIPSTFVPKMYLEAIDASDTVLCYEGFDHFIFLPHVKELILRNCPFIDDWCLHRLKTFEGSLEHLDISGCPNVTDRGICTLYSLKTLKVLTLNNTPKVANKELVCLLLQDVLPQLKIIGVDYSSPTLCERLKQYLN